MWTSIDGRVARTFPVIWLPLLLPFAQAYPTRPVRFIEAWSATRQHLLPDAENLYGQAAWRSLSEMPAPNADAAGTGDRN
jgi:hypothetical protein